jgi:pimeloyl-ACP methyl ester carboxylesterase
MGRIGRFIRRRRWVVLTVYLLLALLNVVTEPIGDKVRLSWGVSYLHHHGATQLSIVPNGTWSTDSLILYSVVDFGAQNTTPIVLLHGTPGAAIGLKPLADELQSNRRVILFDLPGFASQSWPDRYTDLSAEGYADITFAILDELNIDRAHIVGWSNGGAVALHMADEHPDRVASVTLLAAVGAQETEGSGSYFFEHAKYKLGDLVLNKLDFLIPHFGILGPSTEREAFIRNFDETDQRKLSRLMPTLETPTLILHGRNDFLTSDWGAEYHHELIPTSSLSMTPHDHFMPMTEPEETAKHIEKFISRHDEPGVEPLRETIDLAPRRTPFSRVGEAFLRWFHFGPWYLHVLAVAAGSLVLRRVGVAWVVILVGATELDIAVAWVGLAAAGLARVILAKNAKSIRAWLGALAKPGPAIGAGFLLTQLAFRPIGLTLGEFGWVLSILIMAIVLHVGFRPFTLKGRRSLRAEWSRLRHHEWWPTWALHGGALPTLIWLSIKHHNPLVFTCCNPGITPGGGVGGESKIESLIGLLAAGDSAVLFGNAIDACGTPNERALRTLNMINTDDRLGGFPVVLKPDRGEQGRGVMICNSASDNLAFFEQITTEAIIQKFHAGPNEIGVFWVRDPEPGSELTGRIFSCGQKEFSVVTGDGKRTLAQLIHDNKRFRCQADLHSRRHADELERVIPSGEPFVLSSAGNHSQGAIFRDAPQLITSKLAKRIDAIAEGFCSPNGGGLDFGRFDIRYENEEELRLGKNFGVVEVNGVTSETLDIYDPDKSIFYAWRQLQKQWKLAYEIGARRRAGGVKPMGVAELIRCTLQHVNDRPKQ